MPQRRSLLSPTGDTTGYPRPAQPPSLLTPAGGGTPMGLPQGMGGGTSTLDEGLRRRVTPAAGSISLDPDPRIVTMLQQLMQSRSGSGGLY